MIESADTMGFIIVYPGSCHWCLLVEYGMHKEGIRWRQAKGHKYDEGERDSGLVNAFRV